jgi:cytochrome c556
MQKVLKIAGATAVAFAVFAGAAFADMLYDKRVAAMKSNGKNLGAISKVAKGEMTYSPEIAANAMELQATADQLNAIFKAGRGDDPQTRAKPEIWSDWPGFEAEVKKLQTTSTSLVEATKSGDVEKIKTAVGAVGAVCGSCHKAYRAEKKS